MYKNLVWKINKHVFARLSNYGYRFCVHKYLYEVRVLKLEFTKISGVTGIGEFTSFALDTRACKMLKFRTLDLKILIIV